MENFVQEIIFLILNYNSYELTKNCVNSLKEISPYFNILIVDNDSTDNSYDILNNTYIEDNNIYLLKSNSNVGYANGNNLGLRYITEKFNMKYVVVMNPDIVVLNIEMIESLYSFLEKYNDYAIVSCQSIFNNCWRGFSDFGWKYPSKKNLFWSGTLVGKIISKKINESYSEIQFIENSKVATVDVVSGCFFMARLEDLERVDFFDSRTFLYYEENILSRRLFSINKKEAIMINQFFYHNHQFKDNYLIDYKKRLFDRKCFHDSKMVYINNYSNIKGLSLVLCNFINNVDYQIKKFAFIMLSFIKR